MNNSLIDDFLYKAKIMDTGEWIDSFICMKRYLQAQHSVVCS